MPEGAQTAGWQQPWGMTERQFSGILPSPTCSPFFPGKMSPLSSSTDLWISLLQFKGNPSYNRVNMEGIKSKKSSMQKCRGAHGSSKGAVMTMTGNRIDCC